MIIIITARKPQWERPPEILDVDRIILKLNREIGCEGVE
jgi:hypothetical protein